MPKVQRPLPSSPNPRTPLPPPHKTPFDVSECKPVHKLQRICSHLLKKSLTQNLILCAVVVLVC